jgi:DNA polymerase III sliding clamp (beta) subunit (PCNA family)
MNVGGETGESKVEVGFRGEGEDVQISFNVQYLVEGVQHVPGSSCHLFLGGASDPVVVRPGAGEGQFLYVVMPIEL